MREDWAKRRWNVYLSGLRLSDQRAYKCSTECKKAGIDLDHKNSKSDKFRYFTGILPECEISQCGLISLFMIIKMQVGIRRQKTSAYWVGQDPVNMG